ncbi:MAG: hypothetical protein HGA82_01715, partial [Anaerolineales bacterium]|nr:hypothetical protein [Anaerolineales bacterium]
MIQQKRILSCVVLFALLLVQGCQPATPIESTDAPATEPPAAATSEPARPSVVLISWDASRADVIYGLMDDGLLPTFSSLAAAGVRA